MDIGPFVLYRRWLGPSAVRSLIRDLQASRILIDDSPLTLKRVDGAAYHWRFTRYSHLAHRTSGWPSHELLGAGDSISTIAGAENLNVLDQSVLAWSRGRIGNSAQLFRFLGVPDKPLSFDYTTLASFALLAPTYHRIRAAALQVSDGRLVVEVESLSRSPHSAFSLYLVHDDLPEPLSFAARQFKRRSGGQRHLVTKVPLLDGPYDLHLVVGEASVDVRRVGLPRLSTQAHALIDVGSSWLAGLLEDTNNHRGADSFEHYVVTLLQLCGMPAVRYGFKSPPNAPDIVAEIDEETILVAECKVVPPTTNVLETLLNRTLSLGQSVHGPKLLSARPVFFHATLAKSVPTAARHFAYEHGVHLVGRERLQLIHALWERGERPETLIQRLLSER